MFTRSVARSASGFSLIEVLLAMAVFAFLSVGMVGTIIYGEVTTATAGLKTRAVAIAEEGLEAVKNVSDESFANLVDGSYGLAVSANQWTLTANPDITDVFTRTLTITSAGTDRKLVTALVTWDSGASQSGSVTLTTQLTNWQAPIGGTNFAGDLLIDTSAMRIDPSDSSKVIGITLTNTGSAPITIDAIRVSWCCGVNGNDIRGLVINGTTVWSGNKSSGTTIDVTNFSFPVGATNYPFILDFKKPIANATIAFTFLMTDGTKKTASGLQPQ